MNEVHVKNLIKSFDGTGVLKDVSFDIRDGEMVSLLGESGCGKSTTLRIIAGLEEPDSGDVVLGGSSLIGVPAEKRKTVIVFQEHLLFPHLDVAGNIGFGLKMAGTKKSVKEVRVAEVVSLLRLQGLEKRYPRELSGGQRQRVALGRALAVEPRVLLLDEPFSSLDIRLRQEMRELVMALQKKLKITTVLVTHDKDEALMMSDRIAVMIGGAIAQFDTPENIYEKPASPAVSDFFGENNYIEGTAGGGMFRCGLGSFPVGHSLEGNGRLMVRPENIEIASAWVEAGGVAGSVKSRRYLGDKVRYSVEAGEKEMKVLSGGRERFDVGEKVKLGIDFSKARFYSEGE